MKNNILAQGGWRAPYCPACFHLLAGGRCCFARPDQTQIAQLLNSNPELKGLADFADRAFRGLPEAEKIRAIQGLRAPNKLDHPMMHFCESFILCCFIAALVYVAACLTFYPFLMLISIIVLAIGCVI